MTTWLIKRLIFGVNDLNKNTKKMRNNKLFINALEGNL